MLKTGGARRVTRLCQQLVCDVLSCADFNELLVALGAALLAVALQQLAQQANTLLHLLDGIHPL